MNFYVQDNDGNEQGPIDQETLEKWVELHRVFPDTQVRNALMKNWKEAGSLDFLVPLFERQSQEREEKAGFWEKRKLKKQKAVLDKSSEPNKQTAFNYKYIPSPASALQRCLAFIFDAIPLFITGYIIWSIGAISVYYGADVNSTFTLLFLVYATIILLYYGTCLGVFAQTFGMWYWGIFIAKNDLSEAYMIRTFAFTLLMFPLGFLTPLLTFIHPNGRAVHDILTGTRIIRIAARPKS